MLKERKLTKVEIAKNEIFSILLNKPILYSFDHFLNDTNCSRHSLRLALRDLRKQNKVFMQISIIFSCEKPRKKYVSIYWGLRLT